MSGITAGGAPAARPWLRPVLAAAVGGLAAGALLRYGVVQSPELGWRCGVIDPPGWCAVRHGILVGLRAQAMGGLAAALGLWALLSRRAHRPLLIAAAGLGAMGLLLYSAELSAAAVLLALLRAVRS